MDLNNKSYRIESANMIPICVLKILEEHSDFKHKLTQKDIIDYLRTEYSVDSIDRKAIGRTVQRLRDEFGFEIESDREGTWLDERLFTNEELQILIDTVFTSRFLSQSDSVKIIKKLKTLGNDYFQSHVNYTYSVDGLDKSESKSLMYNIAYVTSAIEKKRQIEFDYNKYGIDKKLHKTSHHIVSPYRLIIHNQKYYIMGYHEEYKNMIYYRLDHITGMNVLDNSVATPLKSLPGWKEGITNKNMAMNKPYMFSDEPQNITFYATPYAVDQMFDWLGKDIQIIESKNAADDRIKIVLKTSPGAMKYFALQFLEQIEVISPVTLRNDIAELISKAADKYK